MSEGKIDYEHIIRDLKVRYTISIEQLEKENRMLKETLEAVTSRDKPRALPNLSRCGVLV